MIKKLHYSRAFEKQLRALYRSGQKGEWAAAQCTWLIDQIKNGELLSDAVFNKRTKNGEYRISNCVKYDLGNGYRLVTIRCGDHLFVPYVGGHDETDKWLDRRKYDEYHPDDPNFITVQVEKKQSTTLDGDVEIVHDGYEDDVYERNLFARIDEATLKAVFKSFFSKQLKSAGV